LPHWQEELGTVKSSEAELFAKTVGLFASWLSFWPDPRSILEGLVMPVWKGHPMQISEKASLLRIFIGEDDRAGTAPLYEAIVLKAREAHLAGATVLRGPLGFGRSSMLHTTKILRLSQDLPVVIEIVDTEAKIQAFLPTLSQLIGSGLITLESVTVIRYGDNDSGSTASIGAPPRSSES
jgi:uncharacterized protein